MTSGIAALALAPPAHGEMLLIPLAPRAGDGLAALVVARGGRLAGGGPIAGSLVVDADRDRLAADLWRRGVVAVAGAAARCGGDRR